MEIRENKNVCIIAPLCSKLDNYKLERIFNKINIETRRVAIDLQYVQDCSIDLIESLCNLTSKKLGIFNIPSNIFVLFNIMSVDKKVNLYVSENDFEENKRQLINRNFEVL